MKKLISSLLCLILVIGSVGAIAFAEDVPVITATNAITDTKVPTGTKMQISATVENLGTNTVAAFVNGNKTVLTADAAGKYSYNEPIGSGYNEICIAVLDASDNVLAQSTTWNIFGLSLIGEGSVITNGTFEGFTNDTESSAYTNGINSNIQDNISGGKAYYVTEGDNTYVTIRSWGSANSDPTGNANKFGSNVMISSVAGDMTGVSEISIDYRFDKVEAIGTPNTETHIGAVTDTYAINSAETLKSSAYAVERTVGVGKGRTTADINILGIQYVVEDPYNKGNVVENKREAYTLPSGIKVNTRRDTHMAWSVDIPNGKPVFIAFADDGSELKFYPNNIDYTTFNNYKVIVDIPNNMTYGYANGEYVGSGRCWATTQTNDTASADYGVKILRPYSTKWPNTRNMRVYSDYDLIGYSSIDNFMVTSYADGFASTETSIVATNKITETTLPAGTKMNIEAVASNVPVGAKVAAFANGTKTELTAQSGKYYYKGALAEGYNAIYLAIVGTDGKILKDDEGNEYKTETWVYNAFGIKGDGITNFYSDFENGMEEYTKSGTTYNVPKTQIGNANNNEYVGNFNPKRVEIAEESGNHYIQHTLWSSDVADPTVSGTSGTEAMQRAVYGASVTGLSGIIETSVDFRFEKIELIDSATGDVSSTIKPTAEHLMGSSKIGLPGGETAVMMLKYYSSDFYTSYKESGVFKVNNNVLNAMVYDEDGNQVLTPLTTDPSEWHNYKAIINTANNTMYIYVDDELVASGLAFAIPQDGETPAVVPTHLDSACYTGVQSPRIYDSTSNHARVYTNFDNYKIETYSDGATAPTTEAFVNISANGVGLVPANLESGNKVADMAIIAKAADGSVEIQSYNAESTTDTYKYFEFAKPAVKVYVWEWGTLKPLYAPVYSSVE